MMMKKRGWGPLPALLIFGAGLMVYRLLVIGTIPLSPDEAYYWSWSRRLALCYYDQPGMIAWVNWLFGRLFPRPSVFTVRLPAVFLSALSLYLWYRVYREYGGTEKEAAVFAWGFSLLPFSWFYGLFIIHDSVLMPWVALAVWALIRLVKYDGRAADWFFFSVALAGAMYAKLSAVMLVWGLGLYMLWSPRGRRWWKRWPPYAAGVLSAFLCSPGVFWNLRHDFITLRAVQELTAKEASSGAERLHYMSEYILSQVGIFSPLIGLGVFIFFLKGVKETFRRPEHDQVVLPVCLALPILGYFFIQSLRSHVFGNWPNVSWLPLAMLAFHLGSQELQAGRWGRQQGVKGLRFWLAVALALDLALVLLLSLHLQARIFRPLLDLLEERLRLEKRIDWRADLDFGGWEEMVTAVTAARTEVDFLLARRYQVAAMLEFMLPDQPYVECYNRGKRGNQWDLWSTLEERRGQSALYVDYRRMPAVVRERWEEVELLGRAPLIVGESKRPIKEWYIYRCRGWKPEQ